LIASQVEAAARPGGRSSVNSLLSVAAGVLAVAALYVSSYANSVWPPIACLLAIAGAIAVREGRGNLGRAPLNAGMLYMAVILLYSVYPLLDFAVLDGVYTIFNEPRLFDMQPRADTVSRIGWYYVAYAAAFLAAYTVTAGAAQRNFVVTLRPTSRAMLWAVFLFFIVLRGLVFLADTLFAAPTTDYLASYLRYSHLPLLAQQLLGHANGMLSVLGIALVTVACLDWRRSRWWLCGWLTLEFFNLVFAAGSRTDFVLLMLALAVSYHMLVRPISTLAMAGGGLLLVAGFLSLGAMRAYQEGGTVGAGIEVLSSANEFDSLFANAVDIDHLLEAGRIDRGEIAAAVYLGDIIGLVPQQLMPFEKINLSRWYVETFYWFHAEIGGGFAFGAIPEALVGGGPVDVLWRAALVGLALGWLDRRLRSGPTSLAGFVFYVWVLSSSYLMFRITTLALVPIFFYRVVPVLLVVLTLAELLTATGRPDRARSTLKAGVE